MGDPGTYSERVQPCGCRSLPDGQHHSDCQHHDPTPKLGYMTLLRRENRRLATANTRLRKRLEQIATTAQDSLVEQEVDLSTVVPAGTLLMDTAESVQADAEEEWRSADDGWGTPKGYEYGPTTWDGSE